MQTNRETTPLPLATPRVQLREVRLSDYERLYQLVSQVEASSRWRFRGSTPSPNDFQDLLWRGVIVQFAVVQRSTGAVVGLLTGFDADFANGTVHVAALLAPEVHGQGWPVESWIMFLDYVFASWPFRKVYVESITFNANTFVRGLGKYFRQEGRLVAHEYYAGRYWDVVLMALFREDWERYRQRFIGTLLNDSALPPAPGQEPA